jgi:hypothetical protein
MTTAEAAPRPTRRIIPVVAAVPTHQIIPTTQVVVETIPTILNPGMTRIKAYPTPGKSNPHVHETVKVGVIV